MFSYRQRQSWLVIELHEYFPTPTNIFWTVKKLTASAEVSSNGELAV
jgi:hypothetical protein